MTTQWPFNRRAFLGATLAAAAAVAIPGGVGAAYSRRPAPGSVPNPAIPPGTDTLPEIRHIVVVMMENHSFDNLLGTIGRGDGLPMGKDGRPRPTNPNGHGELVRSFHMATPCQLQGFPSNTWDAGHQSFDGGSMEGFVQSASGPVSMGYWTALDMPFTAGLARTFPIGDRYFSSVMAQTYPNREYLMAATSRGSVSDDLMTTLPPAGTIFDQLDRHGLVWCNYYSDLPSIGIIEPLLTNPTTGKNAVKIDRFYADAAAGRLPDVSLVDPNFGNSSEEDPQDIQRGDVFLASVVNAVLASPTWPHTLLIWTYDEGGGYYDHVPPPRAVPPDDIPPAVVSPPSAPGGFDRYGFRVPFGVVSPYARRHYVSHVVHDHTSILKLIETKWNLPALTWRDARADNLLDSLDLSGRPVFLHPPALPAPADPALRANCLITGPGEIPPTSAVLST